MAERFCASARFAGSTARRLRRLGSIALAAAALAGTPGTAVFAAGEPPVPAGTGGLPSAPRPRTLDIEEYRVEGVTRLSTPEVEAAVSPFLGPGRALEDVEKARAALEKAYSDKGYQSVAVAIPKQTVRDGVVVLEVTEGKVGRLRVHGARWFSPFDVKKLAPSVAEGAVPNFNDLLRDIVALNQIPDRRVVPALRVGAVPATVDVDLNVTDRIPLHESVELNDRYSAFTGRLRLNGAIRYDNLWQAGHSIGLSFQIGPKPGRSQFLPDSAALDHFPQQTFSATYLARVPDVPWLTFLLTGTMLESEVQAAAGISVAQRGWTYGARATFTLPGDARLFHAVSVGPDYKRSFQRMSVSTSSLGSFDLPITYWPFTAQYSATVAGESSQTQVGADIVFAFRPLGSVAEFDGRRYDASPSFMYWRGEVSRTDDLPLGIQLHEKVQGQYAVDPLISPEQFVSGGAESVRGYLEAEQAGDLGAQGTFEVRSPSFAGIGKPVLDEWRVHAFADGAWLAVRNPLPDQARAGRLVGVGGGTRFKMFGRVSGAAEIGVPLTSGQFTRRFHPRLHFRLGSEF
jgi:hemolysin activation/secretion protein